MHLDYWFTDNRRTLRGWSVPHTQTPWSKTTYLDLAAGLFETHSTAYSCPCVGGRAPPTFVGNDYFCESGNPGTTYTNTLCASDPLRDGQGSGSPSCCDLTSPLGVTTPWFCKQLPQATTDDVEVRICSDQHTGNEDTPVELIELYVR